MRFRHLLAALAEPQLITPATAASLVSLVMARMADGDPPVREGQGPCGELVELKGMEILDGIATIPVGGIMGVGLTGMERGSGAVDTGDIIGELDFAEDCADVSAIIMDFDTPGGMYQGTPELGMAINSCEKPVVAFVRNAHSAGYWSASCADAVLMTPSASVGSIGVYIGYFDVTKSLEMQGVKTELFTSGIFKGMGFPGVPLTDVQRELLQARVMSMNAEFQSLVRAMRGDISADAMQGQTFGGADAIKLGLADEIVSGMSDAREFAKLLAAAK